MPTPGDARTGAEPPVRDRVEETFELLQSAKKLESESNYWLATENFVKAHELLTLLAGEETAGAEPSGDAERISHLYATKAEEYKKHSRKCLIRAMEQDQSGDDRVREADTEKNLLGDDEARARNHSFSVLFSRPVAVSVSASVSEGPAGGDPLPATNDHGASGPLGPPERDTRPHIGDEGDLEARLRALNQSLPSGYKSTDERVSDVKKGLGKLGLSLYAEEQAFSRFEDEVPKSEDEQIDDIIAQAEDEAAFERRSRGDDTGTVPASGGGRAESCEPCGDDCSSSEDDGDGDGEEDLLLDDDQLAMKTIQKKVASAQAKLAELAALLDRARSKKAMDEADEEEEVFRNDFDSDEDEDEDSCRDVRQHDVAFLMMTGKRKLKSAQRDMRKAMAEWEEMLLL